MDEAKLVVIALVVVIFILTFGLVYTSQRSASVVDKLMSFNEKCLRHSLAESSNQREMVRIQFDSDHQEFLLREARDRQMVRNRVPPPPPPPEGIPDIVVATGKPDMD